MIDLGWFSFIARGMSWLLRTIYGFIGNWGVAIILLTLLVRVLLLPFVIPQFRNMAKQRALKPEIDKINELYKDDREKKGAAMMELWRKHKVNPLGGCLPVLLQMPIFFALYQTLSTSIELYHAPFVWWWVDLSSPDPLYVLPIILGALMFIQQKLTPVQMDATQAKVMLYAMPLMMTFFMLLLPTGLCLYMVTSSAIGITQQRYMYWKMDQETAALATDSDDATTTIAIKRPQRSRPPHPSGPSPAERRGLAVDELKNKPRDGALILDQADAGRPLPIRRRRQGRGSRGDPRGAHQLDGPRCSGRHPFRRRANRARRRRARTRAVSSARRAPRSTLSSS